MISNHFCPVQFTNPFSLLSHVRYVRCAVYSVGIQQLDHPIDKIEPNTKEFCSAVKGEIPKSLHVFAFKLQNKYDEGMSETKVSENVIRSMVNRVDFFSTLSFPMNRISNDTKVSKKKKNEPSNQPTSQLNCYKPTAISE